MERKIKTANFKKKGKTTENEAKIITIKLFLVYLYLILQLLIENAVLLSNESDTIISLVEYNNT